MQGQKPLVEPVRARESYLNHNFVVHFHPLTAYTINGTIYCTTNSTKLCTIGGENMLAVNYSTIRNNLKGFCDKVTDDYETVIITRKDEKNVVLISLEQYNAMQKAIRNSQYLDMIDKAMGELEAGGFVTKTFEELADEEQ